MKQHYMAHSVCVNFDLQSVQEQLYYYMGCNIDRI